ncbi:MAG: hypothetical protein EOO43_02120 [Flavobacterium sp.]|nr:MAG: hypothetical protein EOO43_02120 [Flavobacterium sp.]
MRFSQRIGKVSVRSLLQIDSIDDNLKSSLWNVFMEHIELLKEEADYFDDISPRSEVCRVIWKDFLNKPINSLQKDGGRKVIASKAIDQIYKWFDAAEWFEVYDFVEFVASILIFPLFHKNIQNDFNESLEKGVSGFRFVDKLLVLITSEEEIKSIEDAITSSEKFISINTHLTTALDLLSDRQTPDYRNSIKEAISAVEALCRIITEDGKATLGKALAIIEKQHNLHSSLKEAYNKLYGYTSDAAGIRHSMLEDGVDITFEDAKFMLVSCSAFINYLKSKLKI